MNDLEKHKALAKLTRLVNDMEKALKKSYCCW
jgi:hypothetical protein